MLVTKRVGGLIKKKKHSSLIKKKRPSGLTESLLSWQKLTFMTLIGIFRESEVIVVINGWVKK